MVSVELSRQALERRMGTLNAKREGKYPFWKQFKSETFTALLNKSIFTVVKTYSICIYTS